MAHPLKSLDLVQQPEVSGRAFLFQHLLRRQKPEHAKSVTHIYTDDAVPGVAFAAVILIPRLPRLQRAAVNIDDHGRLLQVSGRLPNIEIKAVLRIRRAVIVFQRDLIVVITDDLRERTINGQILRLHGHRRKGIALKDVRPRLGILRLLPAQLAHRRRRIGNPGKQFHTAVAVQDYAPDVAISCGIHFCSSRIRCICCRNPLERRPGDEHDPHAYCQINQNPQRLLPPAPAAHAFPANNSHSGKRKHKQKPSKQRVLIQFQHSTRNDADQDRYDPSQNSHLYILQRGADAINIFVMGSDPITVSLRP